MKIISIGLFIVSIVGLSVFAMPAQAEGQKGVIIIYSSRYGSTAQTAEWIAEGMEGKAVAVSVKDAGDLGGYGKVILGSGIYFDQLHSDMIAFLETRREEVSNKLLAVFVVCGTPPDQAQGYLDMFAEKCKTKPLLMRAFNGWTKKELLSPEDYKSLEEYYKSVKEPFENYDNTDRAKCLEFGKEILEKIRDVK
ncbi:MAG: flavodoxin domain-containing protein [Acidobacteria bacterium]|nr:flavodoxin domain-containing protein [Acidobacteriota bacterium]MBU4405864.1 flavodoxin domain-containing protein [Acidobacteriota bacterium]MCG2811334.1 flavodoxin domain-containing protein [Candidatus Aminicenantes bacterium]